MRLPLLEIPVILGFSIEVYFIVLILVIPFFFFWRWVFRKISNNKLVIATLSWVAAFIIAPITYSLLIFIWIAAVSYYPSKNFDANKWFENKEKRYELSENIIESHILIGKTKAEVRQLLGNEDNTDQSDYWRYYLGFKPSLLGIDPDVLDVYFKKDRVVEVKQHET